MGQKLITVRSKWILPVDQPPIENGSIEIRDGVIESVHRRIDHPADVDLGNAIVFPQFVNPHTHLEFSQLSRPIGKPLGSFADWIRQVIELRRGPLAEQQATGLASAIEKGLSESRGAAIAALGEILSLPWDRNNYVNTDPTCVVFHERIGLSSDKVKTTIAELDGILGREAASIPSIRMGLSPHAPYSAHIQLVQGMAQIARRYRLPIAMHLAESREELELLQSHSGPLRNLLEDLGVWHSDAIASGLSILDYLKLLSTCERSLVIHGNYLTNRDLDFVANHRRTMTIVYCPRTHAFFGHDRYPLLQMIERSIEVAIATDSRASNPDLSLANDISCAAEQFPAIPAGDWLRMATLIPARGIGLDHQLGSLAPGKLARLAMVKLENSSKRDPESDWLSAIQLCRRVELD